MSKVLIGGVVAAILVVFGAIAGDDQPQSSLPENSVDITASEQITEAAVLVCDGIAVTTDCLADDVLYSTYIYHPAAPEKTRTEKVTTYEEEVVGYCTLCNDGTRSPSCATGRGACSRHGGVAQWNAPIYRSVPRHDVRAIVEVPAKEAHYEKIPR